MLDISVLNPYVYFCCFSFSSSIYLKCLFYISYILIFWNWIFYYFFDNICAKTELFLPKSLYDFIIYDSSINYFLMPSSIIEFCFTFNFCFLLKSKDVGGILNYSSFKFDIWFENLAVELNFTSFKMFMSECPP